MNRKSVRNELLKKLQDLGRKVSTQTVFLHQAIAQSVGLNATDTKCIDLILSHADGSVTAGWLSDVTGLTTGAITHILDRLEKRHFLERVRDTQDRRKVFIRVRPESLKPLLPKYEEIGNAYVRLAEGYSDDDLQVICDYMERASEVAGRQLTSFIAGGGSSLQPSSKQVNAQRQMVETRKKKKRY
jgi:DNA-binding MarR family transcriptional regulator